MREGKLVVDDPQIGAPDKAVRVGDHAQPRLPGLVAEGFDDLQVAAPAALGDARENVIQDGASGSFLQ